MIEKMKKIIVLAPSERKSSLIDGIRDLGVIHITEKAAPDAGLSARLAELTRMRSVLSEMPKVPQKEVLTGAAFEALHKSLVSATEEKRRISESLVKMKVEREKIAKWGDFNPQDLDKLSEKGLDFSFYLISQKEIANIPEDCRYIVLKSIDKQCAIAALDELPASFGSGRFAIPKLGLSQMDAFYENLNDSAYVELHQGRYLINYALAGCKYCRIGAEKVTMMIDRHGISHDRLKFFIGGSDEAIDKFIETTGTSDYQHWKIPAPQFMAITFGQFPLYVFIEDGKVMNAGDFRMVDDKLIMLLQ